MAKNIDPEIRARIDSFVEELSALVRKAAVTSVEEVLGPGSGPRGPRRGPGRPRGSSSRKASGGRLRRSSEELEAMSGTILNHVRANPGHRLEEISRTLSIPSKELKRPVATLLEAGKLRTKGQKRGTKYFAGAGKTKGTTKKATKKRKKARRSTGKKTRAKRNTTTKKAAAA